MVFPQPGSMSSDPKVTARRLGASARFARVVVVNFVGEACVTTAPLVIEPFPIPVTETVCPTKTLWATAAVRVATLFVRARD